jgi:hypothetical protein
LSTRGASPVGLVVSDGVGSVVVVVPAVVVVVVGAEVVVVVVPGRDVVVVVLPGGVVVVVLLGRVVVVGAPPWQVTPSTDHRVGASSSPEYSVTNPKLIDWPGARTPFQEAFFTTIDPLVPLNSPLQPVISRCVGGSVNPTDQDCDADAVRLVYVTSATSVVGPLPSTR